jgi:hypothetical protein
MKVKINLKLLEEQIALCDLFADIDRKDGDKFEGIANLLSEIRFLAEMGETVHFEACEEE